MPYHKNMSFKPTKQQLKVIEHINSHARVRPQLVLTIFEKGFNFN